MTLRTATYVIFMLILMVPSAFALRKTKAPEFAFDSIQSSDWIPTNDTIVAGHGAVMLFERVVVDDSAKKEFFTFVTTYRRIRIGSSGGRSAADVSIPYYYNDQKITLVSGRTIRHNGDTATLASDQVIERDLLKSKGMKIKQLSFSMPGVSDDCIIEYAFQLQLPGPFDLWLVQKDLPLLHGELRWTYYNPANWNFLGSPNCTILNMQKAVNVQKLPSLKDFKYFVLTADGVPAFHHEPFSLPEKALKGQVRMYYGRAGSPAGYWSDRALSVANRVDEFVAHSEKVKEAAKQFDSTKSVQEKIDLAYDWVRKTFKNASYLKGDDPSLKRAKFATADEAFKSGYNDQRGINYIFCDLIRELNIDAKIVWVRDRDEDLFVREAKYWQFNGTLVALPDSNKSWSFYCPGDIYMDAGQVPWYNEGVEGLVGTSEGDALIPVPFSPPAKNRTIRSIRVVLNSDLEILGTVDERQTGHPAYRLRVELHDTPVAEKAEQIRSSIAKLIPQAEIDSVTVENADSVHLPLKLNYQVKYPSVSTALTGGRLLIKPFDLMRTTENPFVSQKRQSSIVMEYASEMDEALSLDLPEGWKLEGLPPDTMFTNSFGSCGVRFSSLEHSVQVQRVFKINLPFVAVEEYPAAQLLYQTLVGLNGLTVTLQKSRE